MIHNGRECDRQTAFQTIKKPKKYQSSSEDFRYEAGVCNPCRTAELTNHPFIPAIDQKPHFYNHNSIEPTACEKKIGFCDSSCLPIGKKFATIANNTSPTQPMFRKIWQTILNLWRQIQRHFRKQPAPPAPPPTPIRSFGECEQKFMELLEGVERGWSRGEIKGFLIGSKIKDAEWENWLQEFGERLLVSPATNLELGRRMVRLGEMNCGRISEVAGNIGRQLLSRESLNRAPVEEISQIRENIQELPEKTEETGLFPVSGGVAESIEREISQEAVELYNQGIDRYDAGDLGGAIAAYETALEIDPKFHYVWNGLGNALNGLGRYSEAKAAFEKSLKIAPQYHSAWNGMGNALKDVGRNKEAIKAYEKTLEFTDDQYWEAWFNRGWAFFNSGFYSEAIQNWDEGLQKYLPSNRDYRLACGKLHQQKGEAHYKHGKQTATYWESFHQAKTSYEQAREFLKSPLIPETYLEVMQGLITVYRSLGDTKTNEYLTEATTLLEI